MKMIQLPPDVIEKMEISRKALRGILEGIEAVEDPNERAWLFYFFLKGIRETQPTPPSSMLN